MVKPVANYRLTATDETKSTINGVEKRFTRLAKVGVAAVGTAAVAAGLAMFKLGRDATRSADQIDKLSKQLGISEKALSQYKFIANQTGVEFNTLTMALQRSTRRIAEAAQGTGEAKGALQELNLSAQALNKLAPDQQFEVLAEALRGVATQSDRVRLAFKLFDSEGVRLLRTIDESADNFESLKKRAAELGGVIDKDITKKAADVTDAWGQVGTALEGVGNSLVRTFAPAITDAAIEMSNLIVKALDLAEALGFVQARTIAGQLVQLDDQILSKQKQIAAYSYQIQNGGIASLAAKRNIVGVQAELIELETQYAELSERSANALQQKLLSEKEIAITKAATVGGDATDDAIGTDKLDAIVNQLYTEEEAIQASYERRNEIILANTKKGTDAQLKLMKKSELFRKKELLKHQATLGVIEAQGQIARLNFEKKTTFQKTAFVFEQLANLTAGVAQHSKALFKINKVASIANAVISTWQGVNLALASYPPPVSFAMAAAVAAAGFANVAAIKSTSFSGGGGGSTPSSVGSTPTINSIPLGGNSSNVDETIGGLDRTAEIAPPGQTAAPKPIQNVIELNFSGGITDTNAVREFIEQDLAEALRDGVGLSVDVVTV